MRSEPSNALPPGMQRMWRTEALLQAVLVVVVACIPAGAVRGAPWWLPLPPILAIAAGIVYVVVVPGRRYGRWRWELHEEELDLVHGVWRVTRTIVPLTRIQHVAVERTGWTNLFDVVRLHVYTAAGATTIPGLDRPTADDVRDRILARLRTPDDL